MLADVLSPTLTSSSESAVDAARERTLIGSQDSSRIYDAEIPMTKLFAHLASECAVWDTFHKGALRCDAYFVDLEFPGPPPDRPTEGMQRLGLVKSGDSERRTIPKNRALSKGGLSFSG
jgi:hypothetical protein